MVPKPILYLDCCALNRPLDDRAQKRIQTEAEAVETLIEMIQTGRVQLASSAVLRAEVNACTADERRDAVNTTLALAKLELETAVEEDDEVFNWLVSLGLKDIDALHVRVASTGATHFVTTDDGIIKRAARITNRLGLQVLTPVQALGEVETWSG